MKFIFFFVFLIYSLNCFSQDSNALHIDNGYDVALIKKTSGSISIKAILRQNFPYFYRFRSNPRFKNLEIQILYQKSTQFRIVIRENNVKHWEIPEENPFPHDQRAVFIDMKNLLYTIQVKNKPFGLLIRRKSNNETIFDTSHFNMIMSDRYLEFSSILPTDHIFGLGESNKNFMLKFPGVYTIWARDLPGILDDGYGGSGTYGAHPMYLSQEKKGFFHIVYLRNSNGMDILLNNTIVKKPNNKKRFKTLKTITYKITGGIVDLKFFMSEEKNPEKVVQDYHEYLGKYTLQPFWSFGFHQSRWGYKNLQDLKNIMENYKKFHFPVDTFWLDIDYMKSNAVFTVDEKRYNLNEIKEIFESQYKKKLLVIVDPGIKIESQSSNIYKPYENGLKENLFINDAKGQPLKSCIWSGSSHFPDFFHPKTEDFWQYFLDELHKKLNFSGLWLDMNEISSFVLGMDYNGCDIETQEFYKNPLPAYKKCNYPHLEEFQVYNLGGRENPFPMEMRTICLNALHYNGLVEYNVHNLNSFLEVTATYNFLQNRLGQLYPFILTRSTMPGIGKYAIHWSGDNVSSFKWLRISIPGILNFNLFGIPNNGADICGFSGNAFEELCARWMQVGSLYPFSRNHNTFETVSQDPFSLGPTMLKTSLLAIKFRYSLLKYYYSLFVRNKGKGMVLRPLFFEFPQDQQCYNDAIMNEEFLIGKDLLITPVLHESVTVIHPYFPGKKGLTRMHWFDLSTGESYRGGYKHFITNELNSTVPVFLREGRLIFRQDVDFVTSTEDLNNEFYLSIALKKISQINYFAKGYIMGCHDFGNQENIQKCMQGNCMMNIEIKIQREKDSFSLRLIVDPENTDAHSVFITRLELYGLDYQSHSFMSPKKKIKIVRLSKRIMLKRGKILGIRFN